jgi:hypothetical protein
MARKFMLSRYGDITKSILKSVILRFAPWQEKTKERRQCAQPASFKYKHICQISLIGEYFKPMKTKSFIANTA